MALGSCGGCDDVLDEKHMQQMVDGILVLVLELEILEGPGRGPLDTDLDPSLNSASKLFINPIHSYSVRFVLFILIERHKYLVMVRLY